MQTSVGFRTKKESEEQQMYKIIQLLQPARIMIHRMDRHWFFLFRSAGTLWGWKTTPTLTDCWLGTIRGGTLHVLFLLYHTVHKVFFFLLFPLVSSCLFTKTDTVPQSEGFQFVASPLNQRLGEERASLPPVLRQPMAARCPPGSLARWLQLTQHGQAAVQGKSGLSPWKPESTVM